MMRTGLFGQTDFKEVKSFLSELVICPTHPGVMRRVEV